VVPIFKKLHFQKTLIPLNWNKPVCSSLLAAIIKVTYFFHRRKKMFCKKWFRHTRKPTKAMISGKRPGIQTDNQKSKTGKLFPEFSEYLFSCRTGTNERRPE